MAQIEPIIGKHRNLSLAERHLRDLERKNPLFEWFISSRRNAEGHISTGGKFFTFIAKPKQKEIGSLKDFLREYDEADDFEPDREVEGGVDYGQEE